MGVSGVHKNSFAGRVKMAASILSGQPVDDDSQSDSDDASVSFNPIRAQITKISTFLEDVQLDPLPDNYRLAYEYLNGGSPRIRKAVDAQLNKNGRLCNALVTEILDECEGRMNVQELNRLMANGEALLGSGHKTLAASGKENADYEQALKSKIDILKDLDPAENKDMPIEAQFNALLKITKQMIQSTKKAKDNLESNAKQINTMRKRLDEANAMAQSDQLTGLPNRWAFEQQFTAATIRSKEKFEPLAVAFLDIDYFKQVNDTHGHEAGDRVLQLVAKHLNSFTNGNCHLARHGGEEFVLVFEGLNAREAKELLDDAREKMAEKSLKNKETGETIGQVTFSGGVADFRPSEPNRQVLRNADSALYKAKHEGRNQILVFEDK